MEFSLSYEQRQIQESIRKMVDRDIQPVLDAHDADAPLPKEAIRKIIQTCATQGLTSARIPESFGGAGLSALTLGLMIEQMPPVVALAVSVQEVTAARIHFESTPEQRERLLPDLIAGRKITCTATTEPDVGSDSRSVKTRISEEGNDLVINGRKMWISNASVCDVISVTGTLGKDEKGLSRMVRVVADREQSPFETRETPTLGLRQGHLGEVLFENCRVPRDNLLGHVGDAARILTLTWLVNRPLVGLFAVNMAQRALAAALSYASNRTQFGRQIGSFQLVQELLADIATAVTTSRLLCYYALACIDNGERANQISAMAKRFAVSNCQRAISLAMEVHGSMGISRELGIEQLYRDVRMLPIPDGTNQILTLIEGRELTGIQAYRP